MIDFGFYTPVATAFHSDGSLDIEGNKALYRHIIEGGIDGIVLMGSTGEFPSMPTQQKKELIDLAIAETKGKCKLYVGTGCITPKDTIEMSNYALEMGAHAVMIVGPYYFSLEKDAIVSYFSEVAKQIKGDIFLYNYPDRTGYDLSPELILEIVRANKNVVGVKDTVSEMGHTRKILTTLHREFPNFIVYSGFDENLAHNITSGGGGCIGAVSNIYPELCANWVKAIKEENFAESNRYQQIMNKCMDLYDISNPFMPALKKALTLKGIQMSETCLSPTPEVTEVQTEKIKQLLAEVDSCL